MSNEGAINALHLFSFRFGVLSKSSPWRGLAECRHFLLARHREFLNRPDLGGRKI